MEPAYIFLALLILIMYGTSIWSAGTEGFEDQGSIILEDNNGIYDSVYASTYDNLWHSREQIKYEEIAIQEMCLADRPKTDIRILDMCCGTSPHACFFVQQSLDFIGADISSDMLVKARETCPSAKFQETDMTQVHVFPPKSMSTCLLLTFSIYMFENPKIISDNAYQWLKPDGWFVVHLVDPDNYDPIHDLSSPFAAFSLQKYQKERQTESTVFFDKFKYNGKLIKKEGEDNATYEETLTYYDPSENDGKKYRQNNHRWSMPSKERMIDIVKSSGFKFVEAQDLTKVGKEYQYLVFFSK